MTEFHISDSLCDFSQNIGERDRVFFKNFLDKLIGLSKGRVKEILHNLIDHGWRGSTCGSVHSLFIIAERIQKPHRLQNIEYFPHITRSETHDCLKPVLLEGYVLSFSYFL